MYKEYDIKNKYAHSLEENDPYFETDTVDANTEHAAASAEGYQQVFDVKVALRPVELAPVKTTMPVKPIKN